MSTPVIGVIEWSSLSGLGPSIFLGDTEAQVRRAAIELLEDLLPTEDYEGGIDYVDYEWVQEHPVPDLDDDDAVEQWLSDLNNQTTDAWFSLLSRSQDDGPSGTTYLDVRS